jgi:hypothetical protein
MALPCRLNANRRWALWLESSEIGGGAINGFVWQQIPRKALTDPRCVIQASQPILPVSLALGSPESEVRKILGAPTVKYRDTLIYAHERTEKISDEPFTSSNDIYIELGRKGLDAIQVWKITSN